jgi:hypothetical protein
MLSRHLVSLPAAQVSNAQFGAPLLAHVREQAALASQVTGGQVLPLQATVQVLLAVHAVGQVPPLQLNSQVLPPAQKHSPPLQLPWHAGLLPSQTMSQLPALQLNEQALPEPHTQLPPLHSPLQVGLFPSQPTSQLPPTHEKSHAAPDAQKQPAPLHSATHVLLVSQSALTFPLATLRSHVQSAGHVHSELEHD